LFEALAAAVIAIDGEPAGSALPDVRRATCTTIGLPTAHGFAGTRRPTMDDAPDAGHSSNSLFMCIRSAAAIIETAKLIFKIDWFYIYNLLD
jgi:hypothetical protein